MSGTNNEIRISLTLDGKQYVASITQADGTTKKFTISAQNLQKAIEKVAPTTKHATASINDLRARLESAQKTFNALAPSARNYGTSLKRVTVLKQHLSNVTRKATADMSKFGAASGSTGFAVLNMNRVVSDAPFGMIAISNNIDPLIQSFIQLRTQAGGTKGAFKILAKSMIGPLGLMTAVSLVTAAVTYFTLNTSKAKEAVDEFSLENLLNELDDYDKALKKIKEDVRDLPIDELDGKFLKLNQRLGEARAELGKMIAKAIAFSSIKGGGLIASIFGGSEDDIDGALKKLKAIMVAMNEMIAAKEAPGIIGQLRIKLKELNEDLEAATTEAGIKKINAAIKETRTELDKLLGKDAKPIFDKGSIGYLEKEISDLQKLLEKTTSEDSRLELKAKIKVKEIELDKLENPTVDVKFDEFDLMKAEFDELDKLTKAENEAHKRKMDQIKWEANAIDKYNAEELRDIRRKEQLEERLFNSRMQAYSQLGNALAGLTDQSNQLLNFLLDAMQSAIAIMDALNSEKNGDADSTTTAISIIGSILGPFGALFRASGGPVETANPYFVGEKGVELFIPDKSGYVVSNNDLQQLSKSTRANAASLAFNNVGAGGGRQLIDVNFKGSLRANKNDFVIDLKRAEKQVVKSLGVGSVNVYNT